MLSYFAAFRGVVPRAFPYPFRLAVLTGLLLAISSAPLSAQDCNANGVPDGIDLSLGTSADCNANAAPDECDIVADPQGLFGVSNDCGALFQISSATGARSERAVMDQNVQRGFGLAAQPVTRQLFAVVSTQTSTSAARLLARVDRDTGAVGSLTALSTRLADIAFHSDGRLFGVRDFRGGNVGRLETVNLANGATTATGIQGQVGQGQSIAIPPNTDHLFHISGLNLFRIDLDNGGAEAVALVPGATALSFNPLNGLLLGCLRSGGSRLINLDPQTESFVVFGETGAMLNGLAFVVGSRDCNGNALPDDCETDCNLNGVPDDCDVDGATSSDEIPPGGDGIPDECQSGDCNSNGVPDTIEIAQGSSLDCNADGVPDECELVENDCNTNAVPDDCDVAGLDCNFNKFPDDCDIAFCAPGDQLCADGNENGIPDLCDVLSGFSLDCNINGTPDELEFPGCAGIRLGDMNCDQRVNGVDIQPFLEFLIAGRFTCQADMNQDGLVNMDDASDFIDPLLDVEP